MLCLLVESNQSLRDLLCKHLANNPADLQVATDTEQALHLAKKNRPDLILLSRLQGDCDGLHFLRTLRSDSNLNNIPCLYYAATEAESAFFPLAKAQGADAVVSHNGDDSQFVMDLRSALSELANVEVSLKAGCIQDELSFLHDYNRLLRNQIETEKKQVDEEANRFRDMIEKSPDWFWEFDRNGDFTYVSPRIKDLLGYEVEEVLGHNAFELMAPEEAERVHRKFDPIARRFEPFSQLENVNIHKNGSKVIVESSGTPIFNEQGEFVGYRGIDRDITSRKETERELRLTRFSLDRAGLCIFRISPTGQILEANAFAWQSLGYSRDELLGKYVSDFDPDYPPHVWVEHWQELRNCGTKSFESRHQRKDGTFYPVLVTVNYLQFQKEEYAIAFVADISAKKQSEIALQESERRLKESQRVAHLGHYTFDIVKDHWDSSEILDDIFGIDASYPKSFQSWLEIIHPDDRQRMMTYFSEQILVQGRDFDREYRILRPGDGEVRWVHGLGQQQRDENNELVKLFGTIQDITERKNAEKKLRLIEACVDKASVAIFQIEESGRIVNANQQSQKSLGYSLEEISQLSVWDIDPTFDRETWLHHRHKLRPEGKKILETVHRRKDGTIFPVQVAINYVHFENEVFSYSFAIDISERKHAEEERLKSEERLRLALKAGQQGIYDLNISTGKVEVSPEYASMLGYEPATFRTTYKDWQERLHPDDHEHALRTINAYLKGEIPEYLVEFRMRTRSGDWKWILSRGRIVAHDNNGAPLRMLGTHTDISQRKEVETALIKALREAQESREKIDALLKSVADALIVTDADGNITLLNRAAEELLKISWKDALGQPIGRFIHEQAFQNHVQALLDDTKVSTFVEFSLPDPLGGTSRIIQARAAMVHSTQGMEKEVITTLRDVTREREADRMKNEFLSVAAHELRTPLAAILGYAELLKKQDELGAFSAEEQKEFLETILQKGERLERIVDDLLDISRVESGRRILLDKKPCEVLRGLKKVVAAHQLESTRHSFVLDLPEKEIETQLDRVKIEQVMDNLLNNAIKYSPGGGTIRITARVSASNLIISVADQGIGMTPEQLGRVFEKFYRADTLDTAVSGLGLGMSIAKNIIEAHGGRIWVESAPRHGTTVTFSLPLDV